MIALSIAVFLPRLAEAGDTGLPLLTRAHHVQLLSPEQANRGYPVKLRGVITYVDKFGEDLADMFVQDETAGIFVFIKTSSTSSPLKTGQLVEIEGVSTAGDFSPSVKESRIRILGEGSLPRPKHFPFDELLGAKEDGQWTEEVGVVRSGQMKSGRLFLNVAAEGGTFLAIMPVYAKDWAARLIDAKVALTGVLAPIFNDQRQSVGFRFFVPSPSFIRIEEAAPANAFDLPIVSALTVAGFRPQVTLDRRIHVRAMVTGVEPGIALYVSDGRGNLQVQLVSSCQAQAGEMLDVVGFPGSVDGRPGLQDAICRQAPGSLEEKAISVNAEDVLPARIDSDPTGYGLRDGKKFDAKLLRIEGKLLQVTHGPGGYMLVLEGGKRTFTAMLPEQGAGSFPNIETGSRIALTGVCLVTFDQYRLGQRFRILLRRPRDILVRENPPWLNLNRALWGLGFAAVFILAALAWVLVLRRQVAQRTRQLHRLSMQDYLTGAANRRQFDEMLAVEFARSRRVKTPLSVVMIDIDYFKALNDSAGHQKGDGCLIEVVGALQSVISRNKDLVARYGGEEFAVILPGVPHDVAYVIGEAIRARVEDLAIPHPGHPLGGTLSVSVGIATVGSTDSGSPRDLVERADRALYQAKKRGRNRVVSIDEAVTPICA